MKQQKLNEPGLPLADILSTTDTEQVQEETIDLQPDEQETHHDRSRQTEAFDNLSIRGVSFC